jgi:hypothetical protein
MVSRRKIFDQYSLEFGGTISNFQKKTAIEETVKKLKE